MSSSHPICKLILVDRAFFQPVTGQVLVSVGLTCQLKRHIKKAPQANWWGISMCKGTGADAAASLRKSTCTHCPAHKMYFATKYFCNHYTSITKHLLGHGCGFIVLYFFHFLRRSKERWKILRKSCSLRKELILATSNWGWHEFSRPWVSTSDTLLSDGYQLNFRFLIFPTLRACFSKGSVRANYRTQCLTMGRTQGPRVP